MRGSSIKECAGLHPGDDGSRPFLPPQTNRSGKNLPLSTQNTLFKPRRITAMVASANQLMYDRD